MTKHQALAEFREHHLPHCPKGDTVWRREAWNNFVDSLNKDGQVTDHQAFTWSNPF